MKEITVPQERSLPEDLAAKLLLWYGENARILPWRENVTPYRVWISEIMLQQTRIEAAKSYFLRFMEAFPDVEHLAAAPEEQVLKLWEGLGYYSRARNLHKAAKLLVENYGGELPADAKALGALPGIGDYTAGAIASIAFGLPEPAVDGNVLRVCARLTACHANIGEPKVKKAFQEALRERYPQHGCGEFTSALMELGETVCLPGTPDCDRCPLREECAAFESEKQTDYPVMPEKKPRRIEKRTVLLLVNEDAAALEKRPETGLLAGLWQFPNTEGHLSEAEVLALAAQWGCEPLTAEPCGEAVHIFSHLEWHLTGWRIRCKEMCGRFVWANRRDRQETYALPTAFRYYQKKL